MDKLTDNRTTTCTAPSKKSEMVFKPMDTITTTVNTLIFVTQTVTPMKTDRFTTSTAAETKTANTRPA